MFEPSRIAAECLVEAYAQVVPTPKRTTQRTSEHKGYDDVPKKQSGGRER